ncbi:hypothetical protein RHMOL_Rhmol11G0030400 [Rhododendron molle]|uniref:Uncharacterized protein n=1 Tax=Rhododendron molle TaxID=49168 RepID=A0ACC0LNJ6_RHOML|nr:hypothetical protein RHMOL_Rhmol11G0030400 [Rhododendron molle]
MDNQPPIPTLDRNRNPSNTQEEDEAAQLATEVENLRAFMTTTSDFPMGDDYLAGMFPTLYQMRQAHQRITALADTIIRSIVEDHEIRSMLTYILGVQVGRKRIPKNPLRKKEIPRDPLSKKRILESPLKKRKIQKSLHFQNQTTITVWAPSSHSRRNQ